MKTAQVTLGGTEYQVPSLNIGQLEDVADALASLPPARVPFAVLRIAMLRANPRPVDIKAIEATTDEIQGAVRSILSLSGMAEDKASGEAAPATAA